MTSEFKKDMCELAKLVFDLSKKHGDIYLTAFVVSPSEHSSVLFDSNGEIESIQYWSKDKEFTKNIKVVLNHDTL